MVRVKRWFRGKGWEVKQGYRDRSTIINIRRMLRRRMLHMWAGPATLVGRQ